MPDYNPSLEERVALITGAAHRIGASIARTLHGAGMNIALHFRSSRGGAEQLAAELNDIRADSVVLFQADLLATAPDGATLVIIEVKTRSRDDRAPEMAVNADKQRKLNRLAARLQKWPQYTERPIRFDVIAVVWPPDAKPTIRHYEAAFESGY